MIHYVYFRGNMKNKFAEIHGAPDDFEAAKFAVKTWGAVHVDMICNESENAMKVKDKKTLLSVKHWEGKK